MNFSQIKTFLTLADCLNMTETAARLNCTQPAISARIQGLEESLNTPLFDRIGKKLHLTANGVVFCDYARKLLGTLQAATEHLQQMDDPLTGTLHFGASNFIGIYLIPAFLGRYRKIAPSLQFELDILPSAKLLERLDANKLEFLIMSDQIPLDESHYEFRDFCRDEMVFIVPPDHRLARTSECTVADLALDTFLVKAAPSATRAFLLDNIHAHGGTLGREMHISSTEAIKQGVMHGLGVSILSRFTVAHELAAGRLCEVTIASMRFERGIRVVFRRDKLLSPATIRFLDSLTFDRGAEATALT
jgi:DNA-binding transcriptional LysR family regulator